MSKETKVVRLPSGYMLFQKEERPRIKAEGNELKPPEVMKLLGLRWKNLTALDRGNYNKQSQDAKEANTQTASTQVAVPIAELPAGAQSTFHPGEATHAQRSHSHSSATRTATAFLNFSNLWSSCWPR